MKLLNCTVILITALLVCQSILLAQDNCYVYIDSEKEQLDCLSPSYYAIDNWLDIPSIHFYSLKTKYTSQADITIWSDGRIAWKDWSKSGDAYFKTSLSKDDVDLIMKKIASRYECSPLKRSSQRRVTASDILTSELYIGSAQIFTSQIYSCELWSQPLLEKSISCNDSMSQVTPRELVNLISDNIKKSEFSTFQIVLSNYRDIYDSNRRGVYSEKEIYWYTRQFIDDGTFFIFLGKVLNEAIPKDQNYTSTIVQRKRKNYSVIAQPTLPVVPVLVQEVSSDLKTPDSEPDSSKIDPKKEPENKEPVASQPEK